MAFEQSHSYIFRTKECRFIRSFVGVERLEKMGPDSEVESCSGRNVVSSRSDEAPHPDDVRVRKAISDENGTGTTD